MRGKQSIVLEQYKVFDENNNMMPIYRVVGLVNTVAFDIGHLFSRREVNELIMNYQVTIRPAK